MTRLIAHLVANGLAVVGLARLLPEHVSYTDTTAVVIFSAILVVLNAVLRPILRLVAFPVTCLTFGLFAIVVNAAVFYLAARLSGGIHLSFVGALVGTVVESLLTGLIWRLVGENGKR
ncbi:MAG: phage holin family protein [Sphaerobacter sp.]|nr:phage holin family protein [Sphaerobacter sp.]